MVRITFFCHSCTAFFAPSPFYDFDGGTRYSSGEKFRLVVLTWKHSVLFVATCTILLSDHTIKDLLSVNLLGLILLTQQKVEDVSKEMVDISYSCNLYPGMLAACFHLSCECIEYGVSIPLSRSSNVHTFVSCWCLPFSGLCAGADKAQCEQTPRLKWPPLKWLWRLVTLSFTRLVLDTAVVGVWVQCCCFSGCFALVRSSTLV